MSVSCVWTLLVMPQELLSLEGIISGPHLHGNTTDTKHSHIMSHLHNPFHPSTESPSRACPACAFSLVQAMRVLNC